MEVVDLFTNILQSESSETLKLFLNSSAELKIFRNKNESEAVAFINGLLNDSSSRDKGLLILKVYLNQSTKSSISSHILFWSNTCLSACHSGNSVALSLLGPLFEISASTDLKKQITQDFIPKFLEFVLISLKDNKQPIIPLLQSFKKCLECYGKSCVPFKDAIEDELLNLLSKDEAVTKLMGKCYFLLLCTGAPGVDNVNYASGWKKKHLIIINTMHKLTDYLFSEIKEIKSSFERASLEKETLNIPCIKEKSPVVKIQKFSQQFCGLCRMLETFFIGGFPAKKIILPESLLGIIWRILSVTYISLKDNVSLEGFALISQLPNLHIASLNVLHSLMLCARSNLLPYASIISKILVQMLKITSSTSDLFYGQEKPLINVRENAYKCLLTWLNITRSGCALTSHAGVIIESISCDVLYQKPAVVLNVEAKPSGRSKKKKSKSYIPSTSVQFDYHIDSAANSRLCQAALNLVPSLLRAISPLISAPLHKKLQEAVVKACFEIQRSKGGPDMIIPYGVAECRVSLYNALAALCLCPHPIFPPPLHYAKFILSSALGDSSDKVVELCSGALNNIKHVMSPSLPTFNFPVNLGAEIVPINPTLQPSVDDFSVKQNGDTTMVGIKGVTHTLKSPCPENVVKSVIPPDKTVGGTVELDKNSTEEEIVDLDELHVVKEIGTPDRAPAVGKTSDLGSVPPEETIDLVEDPADETIDLTDSSSNDSIILIDKIKTIVNCNEKDKDDCYITDINTGNNQINNSSRPCETECDVIITSEKNCQNGKDESFLNLTGKNNSPAKRSKYINTPLVEDLTNDNSNDIQINEGVSKNSPIVNSKRKSINSASSNKDLSKKRKTATSVEDTTCIIDDEVEEAMLDSFVDIVPES